MYNKHEIIEQLNVLDKEFPRLYKIVGMIMLTAEEYKWNLWLKYNQQIGEDDYEDIDDYIEVTLNYEKDGWEIGKIE